NSGCPEGYDTAMVSMHEVRPLVAHRLHALPTKQADLPGVCFPSRTAKESALQLESTGVAGASPKHPGAFFHVLLAACIASLGGILFGYDTGIISGALLQLKTTFKLSCVTQQLVVGSLFLGAFLASFVGGVLVDWLGRKRALLLASLLFLTGTTLQSLSPSLAVLFCGRLVTGMAVSLSTTAECTYIAEISPPAQRGLLVSLNEVAITVGFLLAYTVNYAFISRDDGWQFMFAAATCPALLQLVGTMFLPQSPHYLVLKGRNDEARKVLQLIHGEEAGVKEMQHMQKCLGEEQNQRYRDLISPSLRGRMLVGMGLVFLQQFTGQTNVVYYAPTLLKHLGFCTNVAATLASVGLGVVKVVAALFALLVLDRAGRRFCLCAGILLMMISILTLGLLTKSSFGTGHVVAIRCHESGSSYFHSNISSLPGFKAQEKSMNEPYDTLYGFTDREMQMSTAWNHLQSQTPLISGHTIRPIRVTLCYGISVVWAHMVTFSVGRVSLTRCRFSGTRRICGNSPRSHCVMYRVFPTNQNAVGLTAKINYALPKARTLSQCSPSGWGGRVRKVENMTLLKGHMSKATNTQPQVTLHRAINLKGHIRLLASSTTDLGEVGYVIGQPKLHNGANGTTSGHELKGAGHCSESSQSSTFQRAVTLAALMSYVFAYGVSFGTTTWLVLSEIFPMAVRGRAISVATSINWASNMAVSATFLTLLDALGISNTLLMYSGICLIALVFVFFCVPETKHKSLEEISAELDRGLVRWRTLVPARLGLTSSYSFGEGTT
ncbi:unnamed protein product, partial [Ixodes hexagonus]